MAGQLTGVEGYVESAAMGVWAGLAAVALSRNQELPRPGRRTAYGSLLSHLSDDTERDFAPMNINWGLLPDPEPPMRDKALKRSVKLENAAKDLKEWLAELEAAGY